MKTPESARLRLVPPIREGRSSGGRRYRSCSKNGNPWLNIFGRYTQMPRRSRERVFFSAVLYRFLIFMIIHKWSHRPCSMKYWRPINTSEKPGECSPGLLPVSHILLMSTMNADVAGINSYVPLSCRLASTMCRWTRRDASKPKPRIGSPKYLL
jgi:hypothetical protein